MLGANVSWSSKYKQSTRVLGLLLSSPLHGSGRGAGAMPRTRGVHGSAADDAISSVFSAVVASSMVRTRQRTDSGARWAARAGTLGTHRNTRTVAVLPQRHQRGGSSQGEGRGFNLA